MNLLNNHAFVVYALSCVVLSLNLILLWMFSGLARAKTKTALNEEDAAMFKTALVQSDPPPVARLLRVHRNADVSTTPFLFLGLIFVLLGGGATMAHILFITFVIARLLHTIVYLKGLQPWRTIFFAVSVAVNFALMASIVWIILR